jgi:hypothetical protein
MVGDPRLRDGRQMRGGWRGARMRNNAAISSGIVIYLMMRGGVHNLVKRGRVVRELEGGRIGVWREHGAGR